MGRSPCCEREHTNKGAWTKEEDQRLINYINLHGEGCWRSLNKAAGLLRCGKSCRLRWINYLRPDLKRGNFTEQEDDLILNLHSLLGNKWSLIAARLPGRTDNEIKNYWNTHIKWKLYSRGIDPQTQHHHRHPPIKTETNINTFDSNSKSNKNSNCNSAEVEVDPHQLNLDLSIGLPSQYQVSFKQQRQEQEQHEWYGNASQGVCLCCTLCFQTSCNCKSMGTPTGAATTTTIDNLYRSFYRPLNI